jgi:GTP-binding protein
LCLFCLFTFFLLSFYFLFIFLVQVGDGVRVTKLFYLEGLERVDVEVAYAGEIVSLAGTTGAVTDTVCDHEVKVAVKTIPISPPVISMTFGPNDSPLSGKEV